MLAHALTVLIEVAPKNKVNIIISQDLTSYDVTKQSTISCMTTPLNTIISLFIVCKLTHKPSLNVF